MTFTGQGAWREERFSEKINMCSNLSYLFLLLFFVDFLSLGAGTLTTVFASISSRELLFAATILCSLPVLWRKKAELFLNLPTLFAAIFLLLIAVNGFRGIAAGNSIGIIRSDMMGFLTFFLLPTAMATLYSRQRVELLLRLVILLCGFFALCSLVLSYYHFYNATFAANLYQFFEDNTICSLTLLGGNGTRVFFHTASRYFLPALLAAIYFVVYKGEKNYLYIAIMMLLCAALFITYSRALCFGAAIGVALTILFYALYRRQLLKRLLILAVAVLFGITVLLGAVSLSQQYNVFSAMLNRVAIANEAPAVDNTTPDENTNGSGSLLQGDEVASLHEREVKITELSQLIAAHPIFGGGLGTAVAYGDGYVEYFYHDLLAKTGVTGVFLFLLPFLWGAAQLRFKHFRESGLYQIFFIGMVFFIVISYFNPCLNSVTGLSWYVLFLTVCHKISKEKNTAAPKQ